MPFAQLVIGPPGAGKSTYCNGMHQFLGAIGRKCSVVNLDPANDKTSYPCALDVRDLVRLEDIMEEDKLGPNGGVLYALEELENNFDWLENGLKELGEDYILFDCPGQVELFTHHTSLRNIFYKIQKMGIRLIVVHLTIIDLVEEFGLVAFETLAVEDKKSMMSLLRAIDRASGYAFGPAEGANDTVWQVAVREGMGVTDVRDVQERWIDAKDEYDRQEEMDLEEEVRVRNAASQVEATGAVDGGPDEDDGHDYDEELEKWKKDMPDSGVRVHRK
ncbi:Uncharacterised protein family, ATP binding [Penicillium roqueforti FM164]|uniref:GPN-loop GTPase 2 n=1 Tax=Penicillium roqueforti (strain FM164) TaxID=1365484 RepID=W6Q5X1_PENRF|nr:Uncharacterised protein family, ATP binding [Penicillium roqueforti FM164]